MALDLDGTLLDCRPRQVAVAVAVAGELDEERFWRAKRGGLTTAQALAEQGVEDPARAGSAWVEQIEDERWLALDRPLPGALPALEAVGGAGFAPVVLTARQHPDRVRRQVEALELSVADVVVVAPSAAAAEKARELRRLGAVGLVGDTEADLRAAVDAGVQCELVATGQREAGVLRRHGARAVHPEVSAAVEALLRALT